ncbi:MAG: PhoH family protein [Rhodospirillales bacterium]|nr:PhoH family protein [Rhodospirillales bacterium]MCB9965012.1 PhoH family protein [Rhodospirillales bacterium]MCB9973397.1 PhoH family protein [Rhodospirillales bacterium]
MTKQITHSLKYNNNLFLSQLCGPRNAHILKLEKLLDVEIAIKGNQLDITGHQADVASCAHILDALWVKLENGEEVDITDVESAIRFVHHGDSEQKDLKNAQGTIKTKKKAIEPRSPVQADYMKAMRDYDMIFGLGPAGTGKTYLAVAMGIEMYLNGEVERLIFTRPAVEAGENLGFLPGDMKEKVDPYLRPIYDALHDMLPIDKVEKKMETGDIEVAPLAFMRGRTLKNAFVILDEAQNTTPAQMKMFLTRMGNGSRMVITGDPTQSDLPKHQQSGLTEAMAYLRDINEIKFIMFSEKDVVRHHLVAKIIEAYEHRNT